MADNSRIEWTDATQNFVVGCTKVSPGCDNCYAERDVNRWNGEGAFDTVVFKPEKLDLPLHWRRPRRVFVNSLSDLFHESVPDELIAEQFAIMALTARHTFQVLTKRHGRMRALLSRESFWEDVAEHATNRIGRTGPYERWQLDLGGQRLAGDSGLGGGWTVVEVGDRNIWQPPRPLPNVWLGVSVEDQKWADIRIPALLDTPAAVRFLSCEPLLGPVNLDTQWLNPWREVSGCTCAGTAPGYPQHESGCGQEPDEDADRIDWVIVGGESGPGARPMEPDWVRQLRDDCAFAEVAFFFKQWGQHDEHGRRRRSKHDAGRELDGRTHDAMPRGQVVPA